jgi:filamentous hemagglutinin family protein
MMWHTKLNRLVLFSSCLFYFYTSELVFAQIAPDRTLGKESSQVNNKAKVQNLPTKLISGGAQRDNNLFHSFTEFNVKAGERVYFANPQNIENILTRVTGNNLSKILGTLGVDGTANLFLLNSNGIVFGKNAKLDVNGSFLGTSADSFIFNNGFEYSATNPSAPPLLTINMPVGLQFGNKAEAIEVRGTGHNISFDPETFEPTWDTREKGLEVSSGNTLALVGEEINLKGGNLTAPQGRIELASIAETGKVSLIPVDNGFSISSQENTNFKDINLIKSASTDTSGNGSGNLQLQGKNISLLDGSAIFVRTLGDENGREVKIKAIDSLNIAGTNAEFFYSNINNNVAAGATGDSGNLSIDANNVELSEGGLLSDTHGTGKAGNLNINTDNLRIREGGQISSGTYGAGDGGNLSVSANNIEVLGGSPFGPSGLRTDTFTTGKGGNLIINTDNLQIKDGGQIGAGTWDAGNSGNVSIRATNVEVMGFNLVDGFPYSSGIFTPVGTPETTGNGGNLTIDAEQLVVRDGGLISSFTDGQGNAGNIEIKVQKLKIDGDFARISTETTGSGNGGDLIVRAAESVEISGTGFLPDFENIDKFNLFPNGLVTNVGDGGEGNGGNLVFETGNLTLSK